MGKKVILLNPRRHKGISYTVIPNIGLGHMAKVLRDNNFDPLIIDANRDNISPEDFQSIVGVEKPSWVGITTFSSFIPAVSDYVNSVKDVDSHIRIVLGGPHPTFEPEQTFELIPKADFLIQGEGEMSALKLFGEMEKKESDLSRVPNLAWKDNLGNVNVNQISFIDDLDSLGLPAWDLLEPDKFPLAPNGIFSKAGKVAPVIATRGCPYPCTFCGAGRAMGKKLRSRSPKRVIREMALLKENFDMGEIHFMDDNFTQKRTFVKEFCELMIERNISMPWACPNGIRLDKIDHELALLMEKAGCYSLAIGIEFGADRFLKEIKKSLTTDVIEKKVRMLKKTTNIKLTGFFIVGHPKENESDIQKTIGFSLRLPIDRANFFNFTPFPGSELYDDLKNLDQMSQVKLDDLYIHSIAYHPPGISIRKLARLSRNAHLRFYLRAGIIWGLLKEIKSLAQVKILFARISGVLFGH